MKKILYLLSIITFSLCQDIPFIESIEPAFGGFGSTIILNGGNFSPNDDNTVFFGGLEANILNATENELMVTIPYGAYYTPISVYTNGLYAVSNQHFDVIFDAAEELTASHLSNQLENPYLGAKYYDVKIADLNGDEIPEIVTSEAGSGSSAYLAIFTTSFDDEGMISIDDRLEINFGTGVYSAPQDIALGDLNGDGLLDVVTSEKGDVSDDFEAHTCIFINSSHNHTFSFDSPIIIDGDGYEEFAQLQDIDGDGQLDIVTTRGTYDQLGVYVNTSDGNSVSFADKIIISNVFANGRPDFADLNGDGMIDMVTTPASSSSYTNREVFVYSNNSAEGNIEFDLEVTILSGGEPADWPTDYHWSASNPTLSDIDGDGRLDIIVANGTCNGCSPSGISILRNTSTDSEIGFEYEYSDYYQYESNSQPVGISISDLNGDGKPDILTNDWMGGISIMVNSSTQGNISLEEQMIIGVGGFPLSIATADLNRDSTPEIIVSNWEVEGMRVIHNFLPVSDNILGDINGYLYQHDVSDCQDPCSQYYIEPEIDGGFGTIPIIFENPNINIDIYMNRFVTVDLGQEVTCVECSAFEVLEINISQDCEFPVACFVDPCMVEECQINTPVDCISNYCDGCYADFYDLEGNLVDCNSSVNDCIDLSGIPFPECGSVIGFGYIEGECQTMYCSPIDGYGVDWSNWIYNTIEGCEEVCGTNNPITLGDINFDGDINILDVVLLVSFILGEPNDEYEHMAADINGDSNIDILDIVQLVNIILN